VISRVVNSVISESNFRVEIRSVFDAEV